MGGYGSGRHRRLRNLAENCLLLDASYWRRQGLFRPGLIQAGEMQYKIRQVVFSLRYLVDTRESVPPEIHLSYTLPRTGERLAYAIDLQWTQPHWGGVRWWFICPLVKAGMRCLRRVAKLYLPPGRERYGCRDCYELGYASRLDDAPKRALSKAQKIRVRLGGSASLLEPFPAKPGRMRWQTYLRWREKAEQLQDAYLLPLARNLELNAQFWSPALRRK